MNILNLLETIFRCILLILAIFHLYKKEYKIMMTALLILLLSFLPAFLHAIILMETDTVSIILYDVILFMSLYLGSSLGFYDSYAWWDRTIHFLSGVAFAGFGVAISRLDPLTTKWLTLLLGFTFSITIHAFWEVLEYLCDCLFRSDAQRWQKVNKTKNHKPANAKQPAGLVDTMNDFICCIIGAALAVIAWWILL